MLAVLGRGLTQGEAAVLAVRGSVAVEPFCFVPHEQSAATKSRKSDRLLSADLRGYTSTDRMRYYNSRLAV